MSNIERLYCKPSKVGRKKGTQCVRNYENGIKPECITIENMKIVPCEHLHADLKKGDDELKEQFNAARKEVGE